MWFNRLVRKIYFLFIRICRCISTPVLHYFGVNFSNPLGSFLSRKKTIIIELSAFIGRYNDSLFVGFEHQVATVLFSHSLRLFFTSLRRALRILGIKTSIRWSTFINLKNSILATNTILMKRCFLIRQ